MRKLVYLFVFIFSGISVMDAQTKDEGTMDAHINKHYSTQQINEMVKLFPFKIKELNYYYRSSFIIHDCVGCGEIIDAATIDITTYEHLRKMDERAYTGLTRKGATLELLSKKELEKIYHELTSAK